MFNENKSNDYVKSLFIY